VSDGEIELIGEALDEYLGTVAPLRGCWAAK
jgi:hypothetical protein